MFVAQSSEASSPMNASAAVADWWARFDDPVLTRLAGEMLAANPNYAPRFADYGTTLMTGGDHASFTGYWGVDAARAAFEFRQFVRHVGVGYDMSLCAWNWQASFRELPAGATMRSVIRARGGWQPAGLRVERGVAYEHVAVGEWRIDDYRGAVSAAGFAPHGEGRLCGVVLDDHLELCESFQLGHRGAFLAPCAGRLYLRCHDSWTQLGDNAGQVAVHIR